jgi:hypothetical protein
VRAKLNQLSNLTFNEQSFTFTDFDLITDNINVGTRSPNASIGNNNWDCILVCYNNALFGGGKQSPNFGALQGKSSDVYVRSTKFGEGIIIHEFSHALFGGNDFHCAGGQHSGGQENYFGPLQGGWSCMGDVNSAFRTCNAWDRDRLNWLPTGRTASTPGNHQIYCHNSTNTADIDADLDKLKNSDTQTFWLRDFITSVDAIRVKLPYIDVPNEFEQWL